MSRTDGQSFPSTWGTKPVPKGRGLGGNNKFLLGLEPPQLVLELVKSLDRVV